MAAEPGPTPLPRWPAPRIVPVRTRPALEALVESLREKAVEAVGVALHCTTDRPGPDPDPRGLRLEALALATTSDTPERSIVYVVDGTAPEALAPLARLWGRAEPSSPYVVLADAQLALAVLDPLGLAPHRAGCIKTASVLLAEGADRQMPGRLLSTAVAERLGHAIEDPSRPGELSSASGLAVTADVLVPLMRSYTPDLRRTGLNRVYDMETRLLPAVIDMEAAGVCVDVPGFERIAADWLRERESTSDPTRIARLDKLISTYRWWSRDYVGFDGRIRCRLHPLAAEGGRFSCSDPNLQQVPSEHTAPGLRACFRPAEGHLFVIADYAQIELRVAAHLAPCSALRRVFCEGRDPHRATAATISGKPEAEISSRERQLAKAVNFGFLFGMGARRFREYARDSYGIELDEREASRAREAFFLTFPGIAAWHREVRELARRGEREDVTVATALGRRRRFFAGRFGFNAALNIPVQGTAAEGFKLAMIRLLPALRELGGRGVLCVHDEYLAELPADRADRGREAVGRIMREAMASLITSVPIEVDTKVARSWGEK